MKQISKPMIFTDSSVVGILEGRKNQTRRIAKLLPGDTAPKDGSEFLAVVNGEAFAMRHSEQRRCMLAGVGGGNGYFGAGFEDVENGLISEIPEHWIKCPHPVRSEIWCREAWKPNPYIPGVVYRATETDPDRYPGPWKSPIFMRKEDSRIRLAVTAVKVERLQDVSEEDAVAEGIKASDCWNPISGRIGVKMLKDPIWAYQQLWESIHGAGSWAMNPFLFAYTFERKK